MGVGSNYDHGSSNQGSANKGAVEWLRRAAAAAPDLPPGIVNILDLGSATGKNSAGELKQAVEALRQAENQASQGSARKDVVITHVDTVDNDWAQLVETITTSPDSYTRVSEGVYSHFQAKSFFEQVAPSRTVALAYSGISFHWISKFQPLSDFWAQLPETKDTATYELNKQQAAQDWLQLLRARAAELLPGGHLVATAATLKGSESFNHFAHFINQAWLEAAKKGLISHEESRSFGASHWFRSREEWLSPFHNELKDTFEVLEFQEDATTDPHWEQYQRSMAQSTGDAPGTTHDAPALSHSNGPSESHLQANGHGSQSTGQGTAGAAPSHQQVSQATKQSNPTESPPNGAAEAKQLAQGYSKFFFGVTSGQVKGHLKGRAPGEVDHILDGMRTRFVELASQTPIELKLAFALIVLRHK